MEGWKSIFYAQQMKQWQTLQDAVICFLYSFFRVQFSFWMHTCFVYGSANKQKQLWEFRLVMFHMQSTYCLSWQFVKDYSTVCFCFPLNVGLGQTCSPGLKVWGSTKPFLGVKTSVFIIFFNTKFSWQNKIWRSTKKFRGIAPECPLCIQVWFQFAGYLTKPTLFDKTK